MNEQFYIYPAVRQAVGVVAQFARWCSLFLLGLMALALLFHVLAATTHAAAASQGLIRTVANVGTLLMHLCLIGCSLALPWCHMVLLNHRGALSTRILSHFNLFLAAIDLVCTLFSTVTGRALLVRQGELPLIMAAIIFLCCLFNIPNMLAAGKMRITLIILAALFLLLAQFPSILAVPAWLPALILLSRLMKQLAAYAPLIISMPEKQ